jgi:hypothetical protein
MVDIDFWARLIQSCHLALDGCAIGRSGMAIQPVRPITPTIAPERDSIARINSISSVVIEAVIRAMAIETVIVVRGADPEILSGLRRCCREHHRAADHAKQQARCGGHRRPPCVEPRRRLGHSQVVAQSPLMHVLPR